MLCPIPGLWISGIQPGTRVPKAAFFKINRTLVEKQLLRRASVASYEFLESHLHWCSFYDDYDKRMASYCKMFVEEFGEEKLQQLFWEQRQINHTQLCFEECQTSASGTGVQSQSPRSRRPSQRSP
ncbi:unnamed protein product [Effrenium voratum]|uniref:Uncharacterized protein n=1 Tax=Effrenium voratum TaxID=2562239 RepID=A0AA36N307_9DINO|nr:unnamed protein product [Effrenium voratum]